MAHELNLEAVAKKSDQLNALLFQLNAERISGQPEIERAKEYISQLNIGESHE